MTTTDLDPLAALDSRREVTTAGATTPTTATATVVLDTCVLVSDPDALYAFPGDHVVLPLTVIEELDHQKSRMDDVGRAARAALRAIEEMRVVNGGDIRRPVPLATGGDLRIETNGLHLAEVAERGLDPTKSDNRILAAALGLSSAGNDVLVVSNDAAVRIKAAQLGLRAGEHHRRRGAHVDEAPAGWRSVEVDGDTVAALYSSGHEGVALDDHVAPAFRTLRDNEFAVCTAGTASALVRVSGGRARVLGTHQTAWDLNPRSKEQRFALDLLLDPSVNVVALDGHAGTGKTLVALAAGLEQVFERDAVYDRLLILRPLVSVGRQDVGFLPGSLEEKLGPWFEAIVDAMVALGDGLSHKRAKEELTDWIRQGRLAMESVTFLRGRSFQRTFIIVDEGQNLEPTTLKTILTRLGEGSKIVFTGDQSQIDSPYLSERNNALGVLVEAFAGEACFGHVRLTKGERSDVAELAASRL
ncbi:MAG TPA: PhoH family protein [Acidimicrobiales bacterium]|nr:PhoH family protein [Acidimicrobiales bacterium]